MDSATKMSALEITYYPIFDLEGEAHVEEIIKIIENAKLPFQVSAMSTFVQGPPAVIMELLIQIYKKADEIGRFALNIKWSNSCGCGK